MLLWKKKLSFTIKGNGMSPPSEKRSKGQDKELITEQYEGCQGHAAQKYQKK
jgi:hypothetical protein